MNAALGLRATFGASAFLTAGLAAALTGAALVAAGFFAATAGFLAVAIFEPPSGIVKKCVKHASLIVLRFSWRCKRFLRVCAGFDTEAEPPAWLGKRPLGGLLRRVAGIRAR
jgi:hypothetical protein